ncbi:hypothetical protein ABZW47_31720 [Streptomyces sp. NPDC004549]|uniref:hypothetical protein n=1 Tax=Streptomyces sp. NPDC004549 TaxID=3154283 RepID=UPI0033BFA50C
MTDNTNRNSPGDQHAEQVHDDAVDDGPALDAADRRAMRKLAESAGLIPTRKAPLPSASATDAPFATKKEGEPTTSRFREIAALLVGDGQALTLDVLAIVADARSTWQDDRGAKSAASQYRQCAHHLRQAASVLARANDTTNEESAATADQAAAYVEAAAIHAREADLTAV